MKILLTNHSLMYVGGTEKWTYTMAKCLADRGHEVEVFTFLEGMTSEKITPFAKVITEVGDGYDLVLANHHTCQYQVNDMECPKIRTSHGPKHPFEVPIAGADAYVCVSRETRAEYANFRPTVITNGVDLDLFYPEDKKEKHAVIATKDKNTGVLVASCLQERGWTFDAYHYTTAPVWDPSVLVNRASVVIGCGRTAIEALAAGCDVLLVDARNTNKSPRTDGWVTEENIEHLRQVNFSTRAYGKEATREVIDLLLAGYEESTGWQRPWAKENADVEEKVDAYLEIAKGIEQWPSEVREGHATTNMTRLAS